MKVLIAYPNLPLMYQPSMAVAILTAICKSKGCDVKLFETTDYSDEYHNRHMIMAQIGSVRVNDDDENRIFHNIRSEDFSFGELFSLRKSSKGIFKSFK